VHRLDKDTQRADGGGEEPEARRRTLPRSSPIAGVEGAPTSRWCTARAGRRARRDRRAGRPRYAHAQRAWAVTRRGQGGAPPATALLETFSPGPRWSNAGCRPAAPTKIRVHLQHIRHPVIGDPVLSRRRRPGASNFHARRCTRAGLELLHPRSGKAKKLGARRCPPT